MQIVSIKEWLRSGKRGEAGIWSVSVLVVGGLTLTILAGAAFHFEFIGEQTKLIHLCKQNPSVNPTECERLLEVRRSVNPEQKEEWPGALKSRAFNLADD